MHEGEGRWVGSNKLVELKTKQNKNTYYFKYINKYVKRGDFQKILIFLKIGWDLPGSPVFKTPGFYFGGRWFNT